MIDHSLELRISGVTHFRAGNTGQIVGARVYGERAENDPTWPFVKCGLPIYSGFEASCWEGSDHSWTIHTFANGPDESVIAALNNAVIEDLKTLEMTGSLFIVEMSDPQVQVIHDTPESSDYHGIIQVDVTTAQTV